MFVPELGHEPWRMQPACSPEQRAPRCLPRGARSGSGPPGRPSHLLDEASAASSRTGAPCHENEAVAPVFPHGVASLAHPSLKGTAAPAFADSVDRYGSLAADGAVNGRLC
jgi:hypothetical protein